MNNAAVLRLATATLLGWLLHSTQAGWWRGGHCAAAWLAGYCTATLAGVPQSGSGRRAAGRPLPTSPQRQHSRSRAAEPVTATRRTAGCNINEETGGSGTARSCSAAPATPAVIAVTEHDRAADAAEMLFSLVAGAQQWHSRRGESGSLWPWRYIYTKRP